MMNITTSLQIKGGHIYEGTFNNTYFRLECREVYGKLVCATLITDYKNKEELLCMARQIGLADI
jgi:hypothetical protein